MLKSMPIKKNALSNFAKFFVSYPMVGADYLPYYRLLVELQYRRLVVNEYDFNRIQLISQQILVGNE